MSDICVSIVCNSYNHGKYIERAIDGFLMQKTNFKYEILIHDDASTDNTVTIIERYAKEYPELIKPILQTENQYQKGVDINMIYQYPRAKGKYIALCEGDDYWIDEYKLQKQVDAMEKNSSVDMCAHSAYIYQNEKKIGEIKHSKNSIIIKTQDVILGGGGMFATNSLLFRRELINEFPDFVKTCHIDYSMQIYGSLRGGILYINDYMSVYNFLNEGSWTKQRKMDKDFSVVLCDKMINMLEVLYSESSDELHGSIEKKIFLYKFEQDWYKGNLKKIIKDKVIFSRLFTREKLKVIFRYYLPHIYDYLWRRKYKL